MNEIYPDAASRNALTVFVIYEGSGEWFDLSKSRLSVPALLLAAQRKCGKVILSQMPVSVASSAIPNVLKGALIFPKSLRSFIRKIACIAVTAMRSVQPELL